MSSLLLASTWQQAGTNATLNISRLLLDQLSEQCVAPQSVLRCDARAVHSCQFWQRASSLAGWPEPVILLLLPAG